MAEKSYNSFSSSRDQLTEKPTGHKPPFLALVIFNVVFLVVIFILNGLSAQGPASGIFVSTPGNQSDKFYLEITPAGWTFSIWGFIYTWQALWVVYSVVNLFRRTSAGSPVYVSPAFLPPALFVLYVLANGANVAWLFLFDRSHIQPAFAALVALSLGLYFALAVSYRALERCAGQLVAEGRQKDVWLTRGLVHNGLAMYATWVSVATLLNLAMVLTYSDGSDVTVSTASTVALGVLTAEIVVFVAVDLCLLDRYSRYTLTPYAVLVVALAGSLARNYTPGAANSVFSAVLLALAGLALLAKLVLTVYRHLTRPPFPVGLVSPTLSMAKSP